MQRDVNVHPKIKFKKCKIVSLFGWTTQCNLCLDFKFDKFTCMSISTYLNKQTGFNMYLANDKCCYENPYLIMQNVFFICD